MRVYFYMCIHVYKHGHRQQHTYTYRYRLLLMSVWRYQQILFFPRYSFVCVYVCMYVRMYVCVHVCMSVCEHVCMFVCMHACMHVYAYKKRCIPNSLSLCYIGRLEVRRQRRHRHRQRAAEAARNGEARGSGEPRFQQVCEEPHHGLWVGFILGLHALEVVVQGHGFRSRIRCLM